jgi:regulatory protein YycH of two-component signal transduction system YycFG
MLQLLKRKKMLEGQRGQLQTRAFNLEQTSFAIDTAKEAKTQMQILKDSTATLKSAHQDVNIDDLEDLQEDMVGAMAVQSTLRTTAVVRIVVF